MRGLRYNKAIGKHVIPNEVWKRSEEMGVGREKKGVREYGKGKDGRRNRKTE